MSKHTTKREADPSVNITMLRLQQLEINDLLGGKAFPAGVPFHLGIGHEALAVALTHVAETNDQILTTHRNIAVNLAFARDLDTVKEHYNLVAAKQKSQLGSMNLALPSTPIIFTSSILGNNLSVALGVAFNRKTKGLASCTFCLTGDGAIEEGSFWEALVLAASLKLRVVFIVENNNHSLASTIQQRRDEINLEEVAAGTQIIFHKASGAAFAPVFQALKTARDESQNRPVILEVDLKTFNRHSGYTPYLMTAETHGSRLNEIRSLNDDMDPLIHIERQIGKDALLELIRQYDDDCKTRNLR